MWSAAALLPLSPHLAALPIWQSSVNVPEELKGQTKYAQRKQPHFGGAPSTISRIISRAKVSSSGGTYTVVSLPCVSTRTGISFSFSAWLKKPARSLSEPDQTAQIVAPKCAGAAGTGAAESFAAISISTGSSSNSFSRIFSAAVILDEGTATSNPNRAFQSMGRMSADGTVRSSPAVLSINGMPADCNFSIRDECSAASSPAHNIIRDPCGPEPVAINPSLRRNQVFPSTQVYYRQETNAAFRTAASHASFRWNALSHLPHNLPRSRSIFRQHEQPVRPSVIRNPRMNLIFSKCSRQQLRHFRLVARPHLHDGLFRIPIPRPPTRTRVSGLRELRQLVRRAGILLVCTV